MPINQYVRKYVIMNLGGAIHLNKKFCLVIFIILVLYLYLSSFGSRDENDFTKHTQNKVNLKNLLHMAVIAAENGGNEVKNNINSNKIESKGKTKEGADDKVTTADYKSHCIMQGTIKKLYHDIKLISEEFKTNCEGIDLPSEFPSIPREIDALNDSWVKDSDITVWIDPLDATQEYTEKMYEFVTTMVCVAVNGKPVIGIVHKPFLKETYWGWVGTSKSPNLQVKERSDDELIFIVSRSHTGKVKEMINTKLSEIKNKIVEAGGAGYKVLEVIKGNADVYFHTTAIKKWDICAGNALLFSVGGNMTTLKDELIDYGDTENAVNTNGLVATLKKYLNLKKLLI